MHIYSILLNNFFFRDKTSPFNLCYVLVLKSIDNALWIVAPSTFIAALPLWANIITLGPKSFLIDDNN